MIRIPNEIDRYIMDGKIQDITLEKKSKVVPVSMEKVNVNKDKDDKNTSKSKVKKQPFDDILQVEIKKL